MRLPGMELLGIAPNWLLIWVVTWSVRRTVVQGALAGFVLGLLQDGMTSPHPTHTLGPFSRRNFDCSLAKQRYIQEDFISVAINCFWHDNAGRDFYNAAIQFLARFPRRYG
jgi:rod shape-determining protein MreD